MVITEHPAEALSPSVWTKLGDRGLPQELVCQTLMITLSMVANHEVGATSWTNWAQASRRRQSSVVVTVSWTGHGRAERTNGLACYLKAVKVCSTLNGILTLLDRAYVQEAYALARVAQDQVDDIHFLVIPRGEEGGLSRRQTAAIVEFFQEEFDPTDPVGTSRERDRVGRPKIQAAITNDMDDPSTGNAISRMIYRTFSGYVHGAYVHIMELHSDSEGHYQMHGAPAHLADAIDYAPNFVYQAALAIEFLIDRSSRDDLMPLIKLLRSDIASTCDVLPKKRS